MVGPVQSMDGRASRRPRRMRAVRRDGAKVRFLELFFDLAFVLVFTQCTALMVEQPGWDGLARGLFVLAVVWWSWVGYAWLTSVIDPEEGAARLTMFGAMAALLVVALAVPEAFGDLGLLFALAYAAVRAAHIALYVLASSAEPEMRRSVIGLGISSAIGVTLLTAASFLDGVPQGMLWALAILIDFSGPGLFGAGGWKIVPAHFVERHGLIIILALGESIVVLGVGAHVGVTAGVVVAAVLGVALASALWWIYFDVVALVAEQRLVEAAAGHEQNNLARDSYSYLHYPMVAGVVLVAVGLENTVAHFDEPLHATPAAAFLGGAALYLLGHVALRMRNAHSVDAVRLVAAGVLLALFPLARELPALATLAIVTALLWALVAVETWTQGDLREQVRHGGEVAD